MSNREGDLGDNHHGFVGAISKSISHGDCRRSLPCILSSMSFKVNILVRKPLTAFLLLSMAVGTDVCCSTPRGPENRTRNHPI
jgi:hypothetical protein